MSLPRTARERAERVEEWANLYGHDLDLVLRLDRDDEREAEILSVIEDALWCAGDVLLLLSSPDRERGS